MTAKTSFGFEIIEFWRWVVFRVREEAAEFAELDEPSQDQLDVMALADRLGDPLPWQSWFLKHAFELLPDGSLRFRRILLLVARQNGKTLLMAMVILWRLFQDGALGVIGLAQKEEKAGETWELVVAIAQAIPELNAEVRRVGRRSGNTNLRLTNRAEYRPQPANEGGGRGFTGDMILFDELRTHKDWDSWNAAAHATRSRPRGQIFGVSNAGGPSAVVLRRQRKIALDALNPESGMSDADRMAAESLGIFEWSAPEGCEITDHDGWAMANPSLGFTITEAAIAEGLSDPEWDFRTEVLCQFPETEIAGPFPAELWARTQVTLDDMSGDDRVTYLPDFTQPVGVGIDLSFDRAWLSVAIAFWDRGGRRRVEVVARRPGTEWLVPWLRSPERPVPFTSVAMQTAGAPVASLQDELEREDIEVIGWSGADLGRWTGAFYDALRSGELLHVAPQPALDVAAATAATKSLGDAWVIDRKNSREDAAPLQAAIAAVGALASHVDESSAYEDGELFIV